MRIGSRVFAGAYLLSHALTLSAAEGSCAFHGRFLNKGSAIWEEAEEKKTLPVSYLDTLVRVPKPLTLFKFDPVNKTVTHFGRDLEVKFENGKVVVVIFDFDGGILAEGAAEDWSCVGQTLKRDLDMERGAEGAPGAVHETDTLVIDADGALTWTTATKQTKGHNWGGAQSWREVRYFKRSP